MTRVTGGATPEDIAAITAVLAARTLGEQPEDPYRRWRRIRLAALRGSSNEDAMGGRPR